MGKDEYAQALAAAARGLEEAAELDKGWAARALTALGQLPPRADVSAEEDGLQEVDNKALAEELEEQLARGPEGIRQAAAVLRSLEDGISAEAGPLPPNARAALAEVLSRREFQVTWLERLQTRVYAWLARILAALFRRLPDLDLGLAGGLVRAAGWALLAVLGAVVIALLVRVVLKVVATRTGKERAAPPEPVRVRAYADWLAEADASSKRGDYRAAVRAEHMAALLKLDDTGVLPYRDSATDRAFVRLLYERGLTEVAAALGALNQLFATVWYGDAAAGPAEHRTARARRERLEALSSQ